MIDGGPGTGNNSGGGLEWYVIASVLEIAAAVGPGTERNLS